MRRTKPRGCPPRSAASVLAGVLAILAIVFSGGTAQAQEILPWGGSDLDEKILQYRNDHNISSTRNVAVYEFEYPNGKRGTIAIDSERHVKPHLRGDRILGHSERRASDILRSYGIKDEWVKRIHSELAPCSLPGAFCQKLIDDRYPKAKVTYTWEYGDTRDSRQRGQAQKVSTINGYYNQRDAARNAMRVPGAKPPSGPLTDALARPGLRPGGIDFSSLELRYVSDKGPKGGGISYSLAGTPTAGPSDPAAGIAAAKRSSDAFFAWLALPPSSFWVNLKPHEANSIIDPQFAKTDAGHVMLDADYRLKHDLWPFTHPDSPTGAEFWRRIDALYGNDKSKSNTCASFRYYIEPAPATVRETDGELHILEAPLAVKMDAIPPPPGEATCPADDPVADEAKVQVFNDVIAPAMSQMVNTSPSYAELRRVFLSRVAAEWVRARADRTTPLGKIVDSGAVDPWAADPPWNPMDIFNQYLHAYRNPSYSYTRTFEQGGQTYTFTFQMGGVDLTNTPRQNVSKADFKARWPKRAKEARASLKQAETTDDGRVWLGAGRQAVSQPRVVSERGTRQRGGPLRLQVRPSARQARVGDTVRFDLRVRNRGAVRRTGIEVCDTLPDGLVFVRSNRDHRMRDGRHCWDLPRLGAGKSATIRVRARIAAGAHGTLRNEATVTVDGAPALGVRARQAVRVAGAAQPEPAPPGGVTG